MTGTQINYYFICHRKLWLSVKRIDMEQNSESVALGRFISDTTYRREKHELQIPADDDIIILDYYDSSEKTIHEIKKSDKMEDSHAWQLKYYISVLEEKGISGVKGEIDYPKLKQKIVVQLEENDKRELQSIKYNIQQILNSGLPPSVIKKSFCKNCSYYDLCYI